MNRLTTTICIVLLTLCAVTGYSQNRPATRAALFNGVPEKINCTEAQLAGLFRSVKGQDIKLALENFTIAGPVTSNQAKYRNLQTIIIQLPAFKNTLFSLSKQTDQYQNSTYVGRILNPLYTDGFELIHNADGNYQLVKISLEKILVNCNQ